MRVKINQLQEGCIIQKDVISLTNKPIVPKSTIISSFTLEILHAFLVKDVYVEGYMANGQPFIPEEVMEEEKQTIIEEEVYTDTFYESYMKAVKEFGKLFLNWQAGSPVEIGKVRGLIVPLLEKAFQHQHEIMNLHQYSTKEDYLHHHSVSVGIIAGYLGRKLKYELGDCNQLAMAGLLSDCGMSKIDPKLLLKKGNLTTLEFNEVKKHPLLSYKMLEKLPLLKDSVKLAVFQHHERIDGTGYVLGISGEKLHPFGKIVAIADVFHAMCCDTYYRKKQPPLVVLERITQDSFGKFDVPLVSLLSQEVAKLSLSTNVKLSNGKIGKVVFIDERYPTRPMVEIDQEYIQLSNRKDLYIEEILH